MKIQNQLAIDTIVQVAVFAPVRQNFTYLLPENITFKLLPGMRVRVPFGKRYVVGLIVSEAIAKDASEEFALKEIVEVLDPQPIFTAKDLLLFKFAADYYHVGLGQVVSLALPEKLKKGDKLETVTTVVPIAADSNTTAVTLNSEQTQAVNVIAEKTGSFQVFLLYGVTGSGKTEVYHALIDYVVAKEQQVLLLVPEISLTPQMLQRLQLRHNIPIYSYNSKMTAKMKLNTWLAARRGQAKIIVGTRSCAWLPLKRPGLFIVDEEHDSSFKQFEGIRYSARDILIKRAQINSCPIVLGSATPSLETLYKVNIGRYNQVELASRFGDAKLPQINLIDIRGQKLAEGLSQQLLAKLKANLASGKQSLVFLNRRGFAPQLCCNSCGWVYSCSRCDANMVIHYNPKQEAYCHHCYKTGPMLTHCKQCNSDAIVLQGGGTERIEKELQRQLPTARIARIDSDSIRAKGELEKIIWQIQQGEIDIIVGTQILAKGHHFANLALVAILDIDSGFYSADFRGAEKAAQLIMQVAGRAGREGDGEVILQSREVTNALLHKLLGAGFVAFSEQVLAERKLAGLPPFSHQILFRVHCHKANYALDFLASIRSWLSNFNEPVSIFGPVPAPMLKRRGMLRYQLLLQAKQRSVLHALAQSFLIKQKSFKHYNKIRWSMDVDPVDMF